MEKLIDAIWGWFTANRMGAIALIVVVLILCCVGGVGIAIIAGIIAGI